MVGGRYLDDAAIVNPNEPSATNPAPLFREILEKMSKAVAEPARKLLKSLALPTGLEPVFPP
jgi:hypothetical protein